MTTLRLLADDLTGALDTAAEFVPVCGPVPVFWHGAAPARLPATAALDSGTREMAAGAAVRTVAGLTAMLGGAQVAYKKIDSLLRGPTLHELLACLDAGAWPNCVLAPAFPHQGRITRGGRQFARDRSGDWVEIGDLVASLRALGGRATAASPGDALAPGVNVFDAETDADLRRIAALSRQGDAPVLLAGTGGLAQAIASFAAPAAPIELPGPILGLFGSDQPATAAQLAACADLHVVLAESDTRNAARIAARLADRGAALASLQLPPGLARDDASSRIATAFHRLLRDLPRPGTLIAAGGETLRGLCLALGADRLDAIGRLQPGVPVSVMQGGRWSGVTVVSKSGAFGPPILLRELLPAPRQRLERSLR